MQATLDFSGIQLQVRHIAGQAYVFDPIRKKWLVLTPEEHIRQYVLRCMTDKLGYPSALISVEKTIRVGELNKRFDIVVYNRAHTPWLLAECKAPEVEISEATLHQLLNYQQVVQCSYWLLTNGRDSYCANACDAASIKWLASLPAYQP